MQNENEQYEPKSKRPRIFQAHSLRFNDFRDDLTGIAISPKRKKGNSQTNLCEHGSQRNVIWIQNYYINRVT